MLVKDGFLGSPATEWPTFHSPSDRRLLAVCRAVNSSIHELFPRLSPRSGKVEEVLAVALLPRCLEHCQSAVLLAEGGILHTARVALRAQLEATFAVRATMRDGNILKAYLDQDHRVRLALLRKAPQTVDEVFHDLRNEAAANELRMDLERLVHEESSSRLTTEALARSADLYDWYLVVYALLSGDVHSTVGSLSENLVTDEQDGVRDFRLGASIDAVADVLPSAEHLIILAAVEVCRVFGASDPVEWRGWMNELARPAAT